MLTIPKTIIVVAVIATVAVGAYAKDCRQWGGFAVKAAEHRNGGLTLAAAEQEVYEDALAIPNAPADDMNRALLIVRSVYGTHPTPAEAGITATATCYDGHWNQ
ncbi:hypothetical protein [Paraburkholderia hospita]|uniref:hypothetical protein n=1 Tax=Paraburkholderia hospita TaxID=169430 RepID=UPI0002717915|nr:hypothetical protein [Paraburkholderia hospita]EUC20757.1 hypothetical protein PMI06_009809 [Burkholderia sp. BT03]SKD08418.1 hypothetical protein SAMN06266956_10339 [Paraburkholderia hospita]